MKPIPHHFKQLAMGLLFVTLTACSGPSNRSASPALQLRLGGEPTVLNPVLSTDAPSSSVEGLIFSGLFRINPDLALEPDLVDRYTVNTKGTHYTFYLKKNVNWHDGQPFTAHDVKFTVDAILNPSTNTVRRSNFMIGDTPIQFKVLDEHTIQATLPQPFAPFLQRMTMGILPSHLLKNVDINTATFNRNPIGTGPYQFRVWKAAQYVQLDRYDGHHLGAAKIASIMMKIIPDANTALLAFEKGELDSVGIPAKDFDRYAKESFLTIYRYYDLVYTYLGFNLEHPFFSDRRVRQAIAHAVDKRAIVKGVLKGFGTQADMPCSPVLWSYPDPSTIPLFDYNADKAKALLADAGFSVNKQTKLLEKNGQPFDFKIITNKGNKDREKAAQIIQRFLLDVGINARIQLLEWSSFLKIVNATDTPKAYDAVILGWSLGLDPDAYAIWHSSQYPKGFNFIGYNNHSVDALLDKGRTTINQDERKRIYGTMYAKIASDVPYLFLYFPETLQGINQRVNGLSKPGPAGLMNPIESVYLE